MTDVASMSMCRICLDVCGEPACLWHLAAAHEACDVDDHDDNARDNDRCEECQRDDGDHKRGCSYSPRGRTGSLSE